MVDLASTFSADGASAGGGPQEYEAVQACLKRAGPRGHDEEMKKMVDSANRGWCEVCGHPSKVVRIGSSLAVVCACAARIVSSPSKRGSVSEGRVSAWRRERAAAGS